MTSDSLTDNPLVVINQSCDTARGTYRRAAPHAARRGAAEKFEDLAAA